MVEDDADLRAEIAEALTESGWLVVACGTADCGRVAMGIGTLGVMVLDLTLPDQFGGELLEELTQREDAPPTVIASGFSLAGLVGEKYGLEVVTKPFNLDQLLAAVDRAVQTGRRPRNVAG